MTETSTAPVMSVLAELVLTAMRRNLPAPKYMTVSDSGAFHQIGLTLHNRADLDTWNAVFGNVHVSECPPTPEVRDILVSTMHGGRLLGWTVNLLTRVPLPLSAEVLAELGEAARADAGVLVAEAVDALDEPKPPRQFRDYEGDLWTEQSDGSYVCDPRDGSGLCTRRDLAALERMWGPLVEVVPQPDAEAVQP